jgi:hypothetical protein
MIDFLLSSLIATNLPRISSPPAPPTVNRALSTPAPALPSVPVVYPNRNLPSSVSPTTQPSNKSWSDKVWERYQNRKRSLP